MSVASSADTQESGTARLSVRDEAKPFILIAAIAVGIVLNRIAGGTLSVLEPVVQVGLFLVIFSIMAFVEIGNVGQAFRRRKPTALAVTTNYVIVPLFAWSLGWLILRHYPDLWAGVILYTLTPCIGWYLIFIDLAKGNIDWGLAMLPIDVILQFILLPFYLWLLIGNVVPLDLWQLTKSISGFLLLPFAAAYVVRRGLGYWKGRTFTNGPYRHAIGEAKLWALVAVIVGIFATQPRIANADLGRVGLIIATITAFFAGLFLIALTIGRAFKLGYADTTAMVFEVTARNSESVVGVAAVAFTGRPLVILAIFIGPIIELPALLALTRVMLHLRHSISWPDDPVGGTALTDDRCRRSLANLRASAAKGRRGRAD
jgi:arsenite transporter